MDNKKILEALQLQPLSEDDKQKRHILGRLYGPIATSNESTRNGRKYNAELWDKQLNDEIFNEKIQTKALLLELGHPLDREETDMTKVCACIPELPKTVDGDLYAYVDILDTPNGKILKTLCDYGFVPGISSRGSGDVMANDEVDPDSFFLETWDIVALPAVKKARLSMMESLDANSIKLKKALTESYDKANEEDKVAMKEALDNLNIKIDEDWKPGDEVEVEIVDECDSPKNDGNLTEDKDEEPKEDEVEEEIPEDKSEEEPKEEEKPEDEEEAEEKPEDDKSEDEESEDSDETVDSILDTFKDADKDAKVIFDNINIDGIEYKVFEMNVDGIDTDEVHIKFDYVPAEEDNIENELPEDENPEVDIEVDSTEEPAEEPETPEEPAEDNGDDEVIESLKEMVRQKDSLEAEVKSLKNEKTVTDGKVNELQEELNKYKSAFGRMSELAAKSNKFEKDVQSLTEQLKVRDTEIKNLQTKAEQTAKLTESVDGSSRKIKLLEARVARMTSETAAKTQELTEQLETYKKKLAERTDVAKSYRAKFQAVLNKYVESKASILGVRSSDITSRLGESYTLADIDNVCEKILTESVAVSKLPFTGRNSSTKVEPTKKSDDFDVDPFDVNW